MYPSASRHRPEPIQVNLNNGSEVLESLDIENFWDAWDHFLLNGRSVKRAFKAISKDGVKYY